jgi:hypothetical protein
VSAIDEKFAMAIYRLNRAVEEFQPEAVVALFSGGHDSLSAKHVEAKKGQSFMFDYDQPMCWNCNIQSKRMKEMVKA